MMSWIQEELAEINARGEYRRTEPWSMPGPYLHESGPPWLNLAGNDYLGLTAHPAVREAAARAAHDIGSGSTASRLLAGTFRLHPELEESLAAWKGHPAALLFSSGYLAALGAVTVLVGRGDLIVADRLSHACLLDAARLSGATLLRFKHNDLDDAAARLENRSRHRRCLLITESIFSMDGDQAPVADLLDLAGCHQAMLLVDEAHALGVFGPRLAGLTADAPEAARHLITLGTLGKSLASAGGFLTCSTVLRELLINRARSFIFDTALPPPSVAAALAALREIQQHPHWGPELLAKSHHLRDQLAVGGLDTLHTPSHIVPVMVGENNRTVALSQHLRARNVLAAAVRPPTVPAGTARLRLSVSLAHREADLEAAGRAILEASRSDLA